ncbi:phosphotransferase family protein [Nonomuraea sp. NPDC050556]|uniref:phosphotransferase family protein n=1 Tax=Nonomuraea sp. NPDC050556 TaxID=3364369 RepID=UPI0037B5D4D7
MSTHQIEISGDVVYKRFVGELDGQPEREWHALTLLAQYAPDLVPEPIGTDGAMVAMSRLDGNVGAPASEIVRALDRLHSSVPADVLAVQPLRPWHLEQLRRQVAEWGAGWEPRDPLADHAAAEGAAWLQSWKPPEEVTPVFGAGDGNLENFLWDGERVRIIDFEESGRSDRAFELSEVAEHVSMWEVDIAAHVDLTPAEERRMSECRRLHALMWFFMLSPEGPRNPPGTFHRQAERLLSRLGSPAGG